MRRQFSSNPLGNEILIIPFIIIILMIGFSSFISFFISLCFIVFIIYINVLRAKSIEYDEENLYLINYKKQEKIIPL
jgi:ABC-type nitrate/sulfonate/bicarbonate transport system permease component